MGKRGQITIYILLGFVILVVFSIYYQGLRSQATSPLQEQLTIAPEDYLADAKAMTQQCLQDAAVIALTEMGSQGRLELKDPIQFYDGTVETMSMDGQPSLPSIETLSEEASARTAEQTDMCLIKQIDHDETGFLTKAGDAEIKITFGEEAARVEARIPISVNIDGRSYSAEQFAASIPLRFPTIHRVAEELVSMAQEDPRRAEAERLLDMPLQVSILTADATHYIYEIMDEGSIVDEDPYLYRFAVGFTGDGR